MKTHKIYFREFSTITAILIILFISISIQSCQSDKKKATNNEVKLEDKNVIEIITKNMDFQMPDTIPSGWNTFRYKNLSSQTHFFLVEKYPEGKTLKDAKTFVIPHFTNGMKFLNEGKPNEGFSEFGKLPKWYNDVEALGGSGLISPGHISETTIKLDPGYYIIECYVKMSTGVFHSSKGMIKALIVSNIDSGNTELKADITIDISSAEGIKYNIPITSGTHTFSVYFKDQIVHENFVGHDINLVKLNETANLKDLEQWMNWVDPKGLIEPAPSGITFLGGVNDMPAGHKGYFTVLLKPGRYALISEVPNALSKNLLKTFLVSELP